jgi:predicted GNAT superfamily acetyltransferase
MKKLSNTEQNNIKIGFPNMSEINQILDIQNSVLLKNKNLELNDSLEKEGFLVNEINAEDLNYAIEHNQKESFIVVSINKDNKINGYFLTYDIDYFIKNHPNWFNKTGVNPKIIKDKKVLYGKHLASDKTINGIGKSLYTYMFNLIKKRGYSLYLGEICEGPIKNNKSLDFHTNEFGMKKISEYKDTNNITWGIYLKEI